MALFGRRGRHGPSGERDAAGAADAVERYEYVLATAQPDQRFAVHAAAFATLSGTDRERLRTRLTEAVAPVDAPIDARAETLARVATDAEGAASGSLARILGPLLPVVAGAVVASPLAIALFPYDYGAVAGGWAEDAEDDGLL